MTAFTILGGSGFIGTHLVAELRRRGLTVAMPERDRWDVALRDEPGHVVYCAGVTADFRTRSLDTVRAHVCRLIDVLDADRFDSLLYLSSARIYSGSRRAAEESTFDVDPRSPGDLYNLSKLTGESLCLTRGDDRIRVARLANVYGPDWESDNFLMSVVRAAAENGCVEFRTAPESSKDYISIDDVVPLLIAIAEGGTQAIYNVASGVSTTNVGIAGVLARCGIAVEWVSDAPSTVFPPIDASRVRDEFGFTPRSVLDDLPQLIERCRRAR